MSRSDEPVLRPTGASVEEFLATVPERRQREAEVLTPMLEEIAGEPAIMWGPSIIGCGRYRYKYATGRTGEAGRIGFSPRKAALTVYLADGTEHYAEQLARLGKHRTSVACLYINKLADIDLDVLREIIELAWVRVGEMEARMHA
ncbi:MAG: DUF1801 domain-containing protein [Microbacteriaceae bacterium]|nr:DUF1801 domain-containing protein [Microbacteriaceae bacterium]